MEILNSFILPDKGFKKESDLATWFGRQIKDRGGFFHKISDESSGMKPCDAVFALEGIHGLIEFKMQKTKKCKPFFLLRGSSPKLPGFQVKGLSLNSKNGGLSLVAVYNKSNNSLCIIDFITLDSNNDFVIGDQDT